MPTKTFSVRPARLIEGDPFGLHDPLTLQDIVRIERALADGSIEGVEAERLRTIYQEHQREFAKALAPAVKVLTDSIPRIDVFAMLPKVDLSEPLRSVQEAVSRPLVESFKSIGAATYSPAVRSVPHLELPAGALVNHHPANMEALAGRQVAALDELCAHVDALTASVVESERQAGLRHQELKLIGRRQSVLLISVTIFAAILCAAVTVLLPTM